MYFVEGFEARHLLSGTPANAPTSTHTWAVSKTDLAVDDLGRTIKAGLYRTHEQVGITRINSNGTIDRSFGNNGIETLSLPSKPSTGDELAISVDHSGKVLVAVGQRLTRLKSSGAVDATFGSRGTLTVPVMSKVGDVAVDALSRPVIVGTSKGKTGDRATVIRLSERGALDTGFGVGGAYKTPVPSEPELGTPGNATGVAVKVFADGRIVGVDSFAFPIKQNSVRDFQGVTAFRVTAIGALDTTYGTAGSAAVINATDEIYTRRVYFQGFNPDDGLTIVTATSKETAGSPESFSYLQRFSVDGHLGKVTGQLG